MTIHLKQSKNDDPPQSNGPLTLNANLPQPSHSQHKQTPISRPLQQMQTDDHLKTPAARRSLHDFCSESRLMLTRSQQPDDHFTTYNAKTDGRIILSRHQQKTSYLFPWSFARNLKWRLTRIAVIWMSLLGFQIFLGFVGLTSLRSLGFLGFFFFDGSIATVTGMLFSACACETLKIVDGLVTDAAHVLLVVNREILSTTSTWAPHWDPRSDWAKW